MLMRIALRIAALGAKFALTIVIARVLGFAAVADYGIAIAVSVIGSKVLGLGFSAELNRRLALPAPRRAIRDARSVGLVYALAYLLLGAGALLLARSHLLPEAHGARAALGLTIVAVAIAEHYAFECNTYVFSLHRANTASLMLFARTGAWPALAIAGLASGAIVRLDTVLWLWIAVNLVVIGWAWRVLAASAAGLDPDSARTDDPAGTLRLWRNGLPFYVGAALLAGLQYAERLIAAPLVDADALGRYVFAWSIANAIQTIAFAAIASTAGPALARAAATEPHAFAPTLRRALLASFGVTLLLSAVIFAARGPLFRMAHEPLDAASTLLLAILLLSFVLRGAIDLLWAAAIALRAGRAFACAAALFAAGSLPVLGYAIRAHGALGAACGHLFVSVLLAVGFGGLLIRARTGSAAGRFAPPREAKRHAL
jgi:O-antigen/teichoic acid export membrane protein